MRRQPTAAVLTIQSSYRQLELHPYRGTLCETFLGRLFTLERVVITDQSNNYTKVQLDETESLGLLTGVWVT